MKEVADKSVHLVVTSPPYWNIKDYGHPKQIGYRDDLEDYLEKLGNVWSECVRVLAPACRLCINIGDQYLRANSSEDKPYQIIPLHAYIVNRIMQNHMDDLVYLGSIIWNKIPTTKTSGGASVMGSYGYPRNGYVSYNYEYIAIFKKKKNKGDIEPKPKPEAKQKAVIDLPKWRELFNGIWNFSDSQGEDFNVIWSFNGARQVNHVATFPDELPKRLMQMFTYEGDTVLDPFLGSGTTTKVALELGRNSIGYEIGFKSPSIDDTLNIIKEKIHYNNTPIEMREKVFPNLS
ncbi:MAG: site-specific DNA-methyltransferase [Candidatus Bathyarchaeia archaeon]